MNFNLDSWGGVVAFSAIFATVMGFIVRGWNTVRSFINQTIGVFIVHTNLEDSVTSQAVLAYLLENNKRWQFGQQSFGGKHEIMRIGKYGHIPFESFAGKRLMFWSGHWPLFYGIIQNQQKADEKSVIYWGSKPPEEVRACLIYLRGTINVEDIVKKASAIRNEKYWAVNDKKQRRFFIKKVPDAQSDSYGDRRHSAGTDLAWYNEGVYRLLSHQASELGRQQSNGKAIDSLYFPPKIKNLIKEIELWRNHRDWYLERNIPWKRGWVLYGPPGTGKSAVIRAMAEDLDLPLFSFALGRISDSDLELSWANMQAHVPCIALFEDFDNVFNGRENVYGKPKISDLIAAAPQNNNNGQNSDQSVLNLGRLSFDSLLNCIDGVEKVNGIFTVITTNHIETLDAALGQPRKNKDGTVDFISTRPGRIDKAIELGYMEKEDKQRMAKRIFFDNKEGFELMCKIIEENNVPETPAQFQEKCSQIALEFLWKDENPEPPADRHRSNGHGQREKVH